MIGNKFQSNLINILIIILLTFTWVECDKNIKIIIVGAGSSGIAAASKLIQNGFNNVLLLEAEPRFGGRVNTIEFGDSVIDLGAQWCHGEKGNPSYELAAPYGLLEPSVLNSVANLRFTFPDGTPVPVKYSTEQFRALLNITSNPELKTYEDVVGYYIMDKYNKLLNSPDSYSYMTDELKDGFLRFYQNFICARSAMNDWYEDNGPGFVAYDECEGNQMLSWKGRGYGTVLKLLMKTYPDPSQSLKIEEKILLNTEVKKINWGDDKIILSTNDGRLFEADRAICTPSLGFLKENYEKLFEPPLPQSKIDAIKGLSIGTIGKVYMLFDSPFWPSGWSGLNILWTEEEISSLPSDQFWLKNIMGIYAVDGQSSMLCAWIAGANVKYVETLPDEVVINEIVALLKKLVKNLKVTKPIDYQRTQWYSNPHFRGTYSFRGLNATTYNVTPKDLEEPLRNQQGIDVLMFAGEATNMNHFSTVHGAIETGWREAQRIIDQNSE